MKKTVFISYSHNDLAIAEAIEKAIKEFDGFEVWRDVGGIKPGERISDVISNALDRASYYFIILSESSIASAWVRAELSRAFEMQYRNGIVLVPVIVDNVEMPLELNGLLYIDFRDGISRGIRNIEAFLRAEFFYPVRKSFEGINKCQRFLDDLNGSDLRYVLQKCVQFNSLKAIWWDLFEEQIDDITPNIDKHSFTIKIVHSSIEYDRRYDLSKYICRQAPNIESCARRYIG